MKIYTKTGDHGETGLYGSRRVAKDSEIIDLLGNIDELNALIGFSLNYIHDSKEHKILVAVQQELLNIGAELATGEFAGLGLRKKYFLQSSKITQMEKNIDFFTQALNPLKTFILPGGSLGSAALHLARTSARKTERSFVSFASKNKCNPAIGSYLNRLSDLLFTLARFSNKLDGGIEFTWEH